MKIALSPGAVDELAGIWRWNAERYGVRHADNYLDFLKSAIGDLTRYYAQTKQVSSRPDLTYVLIRRKRSGHGHIAVYRASENMLDVLHVFHTAQDWQTKLTEEGPVP